MGCIWKYPANAVSAEYICSVEAEVEDINKLEVYCVTLSVYQSTQLNDYHTVVSKTYMQSVKV